MRFILVGPNAGATGVWGGFEFRDGVSEQPDTPVVRNLMGYFGAFPEGEVLEPEARQEEPAPVQARKPGRPRKEP